MFRVKAAVSPSVVGVIKEHLISFMCHQVIEEKYKPIPPYERAYLDNTRRLS